MTGPKRAAVLGVGDRGAAWAARLALMGYDVALFDTDAAALPRAQAALATARPLLPGLFEAPLPPEGAITQANTIPQAVAGADWIVEALPARLALKRKVLQVAQAESDAIIVGAGGVGTADLQGCASDPSRIVTAEAQAPEYLLPLVELGLTPANTPEVIGRARQVFDSIGMIAVESEGVATRLRASLGPMGALEQAVMQQGLGPALMAPGDPRLMVALIRAVRSGYRADAEDLRQFEKTRPQPTLSDGPVTTLRMAVSADWTDYNGHMTEAKYLEAFGYGTDAFMDLVGIDADYIAGNMSLFTAETHIRHLVEAHVGQPFRIETRVLLAEGKKLSLWHEMRSGDQLLATAENLMLHVDLAARKTCPPREDVARTLAQLAADHAKLPAPEGAGRAVGQR